MTSSPSQKVKEAFFIGEDATHRPDLTTRVFELKYDALMDGLLKKRAWKGQGSFSHCRMVKAKLLYAHILLIMEDASSLAHQTS